MTAVAVVFDPSHQRLSYASAGHPPAVVLHSDGSSELLDGVTMTPLGRIVQNDWPEATVGFEPGATVVLYSDGLIERPGETITSGIDAMVAQALAARHLRVDELIEHLVSWSSSGGEIRDDIIAIGLRSLR